MKTSKKGNELTLVAGQPLFNWELDPNESPNLIHHFHKGKYIDRFNTILDIQQPVVSNWENVLVDLNK